MHLPDLIFCTGIRKFRDLFFVKSIRICTVFYRQVSKDVDAYIRKLLCGNSHMIGQETLIEHAAATITSILIFITRRGLQKNSPGLFLVIAVEVIAEIQLQHICQIACIFRQGDLLASHGEGQDSCCILL